MKKLNKIFLGILLVAFVATSCDTLLDTDSTRLAFPSDNRLDSPNDTIYSLVGLFSKLEKLADRYVLLGELRGELMDVSVNADASLQEINNFDISTDNPYNKIEDYYSVINNCNYLINNLDTSVVARAEQPLLKEYAEVKAIRAWTYMQLALNYGKAKYYENPILTIDDANKTYPEYNISTLAPILINDLEPLKDVQPLGGFSLGEDVSSQNTYFAIKFVLGDLYLWNGQYEQAARVYHELMVDQSLTPYSFIQSTWTVTNKVFVERKLEDQNWLAVTSLGTVNLEQITLIAGSTEYGEGALLDSLSSYRNVIIPSQAAISNWDNQTYYYNVDVSRMGDLRGDIGSYFGPEFYASVNASQVGGLVSGFNYNGSLAISKFSMMTTETTKAISVYRTGLLYLRYAEAVNRAGKPNLAFAVLKNGLNTITMAKDNIVPRSEKYSTYTDTTATFYDYANFGNVVFDNSIGIHERGCGNVHLSEDYIIPSLESSDDSIQWVEDKIVEELALETAFEGNRFQDLMRVALRRGDPSYLANIVTRKERGSLSKDLNVENNWYLKP